jgi:aryl-alcohol dehydrogenase-like predicted oxidoreductase
MFPLSNQAQRPMQLRQIGTTDILITPVALGCWPIAGMTSPDVTHEQSLLTLHAAVDAGINFLDTAYAYGTRGESECLIAEALGDQREQLVIASKGGISLETGGARNIDGRPGTLRAHCEASLKRLQTDYLDLLYLHAPDPEVPVSESAGALRALMEEGKTRSVGVSNFTLQQLIEFQQECPISAFQPPYNMLQREIELDTLPWCQQNSVSVMIYWPLMKGLLAGKIGRDHVFTPGDSRLKYPMFQGEEWEKNQDLVDGLRQLGEQAGQSVAQLAVNWTLSQPGITSALCGAKRPEQIRETAGAMSQVMESETLAAIDQLLAARGQPVTRAAV